MQPAVLLLASLGLLAALSAGHPHPQYPEVPGAVQIAAAPRPTHRIVGGSGNFTYTYDPSRLVLPAGVQLLNGHGLAKDHEGYIYFTYQSASVSDDTRALIRFDPSGNNAQLLGSDNSLAHGTPHGLRINFDAGGPYLYHANNAAIVHKTDLSGNVLWTQNATAMWEHTSFWPFMPTDSIAPPNSSVVYVADGYGSSYVHALDVATGNYSGLTFGGAGNSTDPQRFHCPHGINYDTRRQQLLVSDRGNSRLEFVSLNGTHISTTDMAVGTPLAAAGHEPCNVDIFGEYALVPGLDGPVGILDANMQIVSVIEVGQLLSRQCPHPHDAIFLDNGDIVICCWNPGFISYWARTPTA